jgi:hypothetical protein
MSDLSDKVDKLSELATRTDANVRWIRESMDYQVKRVDKHEDRIRKVESRQWWIAGIFTAVGAALGFGGSNGLKP